MVEVEFDYNNNKTTIYCQKEDLMKNICQRFSNKLSIDVNDLYFIYGGNILNLELTFYDQANEEDKKRGKMNIVVNSVKDTIINNEKKKIIKSKDIICPSCGENCRIKIENYKITLYECKNGHKLDNITLDEFNETQAIDESKIICDECKDKNKENSFGKIFMNV